MTKDLVKVLNKLSEKTKINRDNLTLCEFLDMVVDKIPSNDVWQILPGETFIFNDKRYLCKESKIDACNGCDMHDEGKASTICKLVHHHNKHGDSHCSSERRLDGKSVMFVEVE